MHNERITTAPEEKLDAVSFLGFVTMPGGDDNTLSSVSQVFFYAAQHAPEKRTI